MLYYLCPINVVPFSVWNGWLNETTIMGQQFKCLIKSHINTRTPKEKIERVESSVVGLKGPKSAPLLRYPQTLTLSIPNILALMPNVLPTRQPWFFDNSWRSEAQWVKKKKKKHLWRLLWVGNVWVTSGWGEIVWLFWSGKRCKEKTGGDFFFNFFICVGSWVVWGNFRVDVGLSKRDWNTEE